MSLGLLVIKGEVMLRKAKLGAILLVLVLLFAVVCCVTNEVNAQTSTRSNLVLSDQYRTLATYYIASALNLSSKGYDNSGSGTTITNSLYYAYLYAQQAAQSALADYNNGVTTSYYKAYYSFTVLSSIQNYMYNAYYYANQTDINKFDNATDYTYVKLALDNLYNASNQYDYAAILAGCAFSLY